MRYAAFVLLSLGLVAFLGWGTYQTGRLLRTWRPQRNLLLMPAENGLRLILIGLCLGLGLLSGLGPGQLGWTSADPAADLIVGVLAGLSLSLLLSSISWPALRRWGPAIYSPVVILNVLPAGWRQWPAVLAALIPATALEELLFRSLLLAGLAPVLPTWLLVIGLAAVFGLMHLPQGALGVAGTATAGILFALLFLARGSLLAPLVAHYVADVLQLIVAQLTREDLVALLPEG